jgi:hypothetical protein
MVAGLAIQTFCLEAVSIQSYATMAGCATVATEIPFLEFLFF